MDSNNAIKYWRTPEGKRIYWDPKIADTVSFMFDMPQIEILPFMTYLTAQVKKCSRCCIIQRKDDDNGKNAKLVITAGYPEREHGIGSEVSAQGKDFLESVIKGGKIVIINNPKNDPRVAYTKPLIDHLKIRLLIFIPLYYEKTRVGNEIRYGEDPSGVMVLDYTDKDPEIIFEKDDLEIRGIVKATVRIIRNERIGRRDNSELVKIACANLLGRHSLSVEDVVRNLTQKTLFVKKTVDEINKAKEALQQAEDFIRIIGEGMDQFNSQAEDALLAARFNPHKLAIEEHDLQKFFEKFAEQRPAGTAKINIEFDFSRLRQRKMKFDSKKLTECFTMLLNNAKKFDAKKITIEVFSKNDSKSAGKNVIIFSRDGKRFGPLMKEQIFTLFGLSAVKSIIEAHKGEIFLQEFPKKIAGEKVNIIRFIIHLPFS